MKAARIRAIITVNDQWGRPHTAGGEVVIEQDKSPTFIGLLDASGQPLYRFPQQNRIGFDLGWDDDG
jgi:hypothetical protein